MDSKETCFPLSGDLLSKFFGVGSRATKSLLPYLYRRCEAALEESAESDILRAFRSWHGTFGETAGRDPTQTEWGDTRQFKKYAARLGLEAVSPRLSTTLFAVHAYYALLAKLLTFAALEQHSATSARHSLWGDKSEAAAARVLASLDDDATYAARGVVGFLKGDEFGWLRRVWTTAGVVAARPLLQAIRQIAFEHNPASPPSFDVLKGLYHALVPRKIRHQLGEYYTPDWLAQHVLDLAQYHGQADMRLLDPACGSGTFLVQAIARLRRALQANGVDRTPSERRAASPVDAVLQNIVGMDINPLAVLAARANYLLAIRDLLPGVTKPIQLPVHLNDSLSSRAPQASDRFDLIVGNPPWVGWESLPQASRQRLKPLWIHYGLFPHRGMSAILGQGKKDLSMLISYVVTDRWLQDGGRLAFLITQSVFKTSGASAAFRKFRLGEDEASGLLFRLDDDAAVEVQVERVDDLADFQAFEEARTHTAVFVWKKGQPTRYPLPYTIWQKTTPGARVSQAASLDQVREATRRLEFVAEPIAKDDPTSPWLTMRPGLHAAVRKLLGETTYQAYEGVNTGGANGVFWLEVLQSVGDDLLRVRNLPAGARRKIEQTEATIEARHVYPLLRGREVRRWRADHEACLLMVQDTQRRRGLDPRALCSTCPRTLEYLTRFEAELRRRAAFRRYFQEQQGDQMVDKAPFYSMFNVGHYTLSPYKVVWHRMVTPIEAVAVMPIDGKPVLPQETHAFVPCNSFEEAAYLCGMLNSVVFNFVAYSYSQIGGKSFASPHILQHIRIPHFNPQDPQHRIVADLATKLQQAFAQLSPSQLAEREGQIDTATAAVWQLSAEETAEFQREYRQLTKSDMESSV